MTTIISRLDLLIRALAADGSFVDSLAS